MSCLGSSGCEKLFCVKIDVSLSFNNLISDLCKKASRKTSSLGTVAPFMSFDKSKLLVNAFFTLHFCYYSLIWMCYSRTNKTKINMMHERCLRIIYHDKQSLFNELLNKGSSVAIHKMNIQRPAIEMFKFYK